jgi:hypothetical protein
LVACVWKASCTSASSSASRAGRAADLRPEWGGSLAGDSSSSPASAAWPAAGAAVVSSRSTLTLSASNAASRSFLVRTDSACSSAPAHMRSTSCATCSGIFRMCSVAFGLPTTGCHAASAAQMWRTASWPNAQAATISASGTNLQNPSIIRMAPAVPAITIETSELACASIGAFSTHSPSAPRVTRTQATGCSKGTSEITSAAAEPHTAMQSGGVCASYERR